MLDSQTSELETNSSQTNSSQTSSSQTSLSPTPDSGLPVPTLTSCLNFNPLGNDREASEQPAIFQHITWKRIRGGFLFGVGWLLSPLCWWNDLIFNLPVAYGFGYLSRLVSSELFVPGLIAGYWISNVIGILLMQFGAIDVIQQPQERNPRKDLLTGVISSTVYTGIILALVQFHIIDMPALFAEESPINLGALLPIALPGQ